jgi:hypothetical protein
MSRVVLEDPGVVATLDAVQQRTELCDLSGRVIGFFVPRSANPAIFYRGAKSPYTREEVERIYREQAKDAKPLADFWTEMREKYPDRFP